MPKMKTHSAASKRFRKTGSGKFRHKQSNVRHYLEHKSSVRKRRLSKSVTSSKADERRVRKLMGG
ncbi:MAG: 50S ribosomal protein L35 [Actinomycetota bacterium]|nr:50S ribosomal protein L35 [Actinomycetota bacterium]